jgi:hypothetical protein
MMMVDEFMVVHEGSATEYRGNDIPIVSGNEPELRIDAKEREITS